MLKIALESLGCSKNLVDAEIMMGILNKKGYKLVGDFEEADIILVNTCGFIESAKQESIQTILELAQLKETANLKLLIVTGCLAQRYSDELKTEIPEIDAIVGTGSYQQIDEIIANLEKENHIVGCDNKCTYCIIPKLRGKYRSRKMEDIIAEAKELAAKGVKELVVIAQDTTKYGCDLYGKEMLPELLEELAQIEGIKWIRIMYSYPESITEELVKVIKKYDNICNYFDMPIQHASNKILKLMNRHTTKENILSTINMIRKHIPDATLRTTIIVGFPGETEEDFNELVEFVKVAKFDRLGAFSYSREEDTPADKLPNHLDQDVKDERRDALMLVQQGISEELNAAKVGNGYEVLIEEQIEDKVYIGRTQGDAEEIDSIVYVKSDKKLNIGDFVNVKITSALEYDLMGDVVNELA